MKVKTADLIGPALDWAVAKAQGRTEIKIFSRTRPNDRGWIEVRFNPEPKAATARFDPSENWDQGGPIIERELIDTKTKFKCASITSPQGEWHWQASTVNEEDVAYWFDGPTPLIAAMRCFVASKLGEEIEVPDELMRKD